MESSLIPLVLESVAAQRLIPPPAPRHSLIQVSKINDRYQYPECEEKSGDRLLNVSSHAVYIIFTQMLHAHTILGLMKSFLNKSYECLQL